MKHNHVYHVCVISLISLSVFGNNPADKLLGVTFSPDDNPKMSANIPHFDSKVLRISHTQLNGNPMAKTSGDEKSLLSLNSAPGNKKNTSTGGTKLSKEGKLSTTNKNSNTTASGYWESPSRTSLMRLHEFLLMEQLMQD